jgi:hypothetical protein
VPLVVGFVAALAAVLLLTSGVTDASFADVIKGKAGELFRANQTPGATSSSSSTSTASSGTSGGGNFPVVVAKSGYTNPLQHVTTWERTDQGVDATMPVGAPIVAPAKVKIMGVIPNWYAGQPYIWWKILTGPDAGKYQYVAEQITNLAPVGTVLQPGQTIATYASSGSAIEYGWSTASGETLAMATTGYTEGYATTAGKNLRQWLNSLGAGAGTGAGLSIGAGPDIDDAAAAVKHEAQALKHAITTPGYEFG